MSEVRRFDSLEKTVRDTARKLEDLRSTALNRIATHSHAGEVAVFQYLILTDQSTDDQYFVYVNNGEIVVQAV